MKNQHILIITNPMIAANRSAEVTLSKFLRVLQPSAASIRVIGGNLRVEQDLGTIALRSFPIAREGSKIKRFLALLLLQARMACAVLRDGHKRQPVYFWIADKMLLPYWAAKLRGMEINYFIYGNVEKEGVPNRFTRISGRLIRYMATHADFVCMESPSVIKEWPGLSCVRQKILHLYTQTAPALHEHRTHTFGMVCRLTRGKHVIECMEAMARIHEAHPAWTLEIIGSGKQQTACEKLLQTLGAEDYIHLRGWIAHRELQSRMQSWRYLLFPSDTEGLPNGLLEAMGCGVPPVASPVGGITDVVQDMENGLLLSGCSVEEIAAGIERAVSLPEPDYQQMAKRAYETVKTTFSLEAAQAAAHNYL